MSSMSVVNNLQRIDVNKKTQPQVISNNNIHINNKSNLNSSLAVDNIKHDDVLSLVNNSEHKNNNSVHSNISPNPLIHLENTSNIHTSIYKPDLKHHEPMNNFKLAFTSLYNIASSFFSRLFSNFHLSKIFNLDPVIKASRKFVNFVVCSFNKLCDFVSNSFNYILKIGKNVVNNIVSVVKNSVQRVIDFGSNIFHSMYNFGKNVINSVINTTSSAVKNVVDFGKNSVNYTVNLGKKAVNGVVDFGKNAVSGISNLGQGIFSSVVHFFKKDDSSHVVVLHDSKKKTQTRFRRDAVYKKAIVSDKIKNFLATHHKISRPFWKGLDSISGPENSKNIGKSFFTSFDTLRKTSGLNDKFLNESKNSILQIDGKQLSKSSPQVTLDDFKEFVPDLETRQLISSYSHQGILSPGYVELFAEHPDLVSFQPKNSQFFYVANEIDKGVFQFTATSQADLEKTYETSDHNKYHCFGVQASMTLSKDKLPNDIEYSYYLR